MKEFWQVYLLTPIDARRCLKIANTTLRARQQRCERYLKHIATQTVTCRLLAHTCTYKHHLVDLLSMYYTSKCATNTREIEPMELECIGSAVGVRNRGPSSTTLLISFNGVPWRNFFKSTVTPWKMGHVSQTTLMASSDTISLCIKFDSSNSFGHSRDRPMDEAPIFKIYCTGTTRLACQ